MLSLNPEQSRGIGKRFSESTISLESQLTACPLKMPSHGTSMTKVEGGYAHLAAEVLILKGDTILGS